MQYFLYCMWLNKGIHLCSEPETASSSHPHRKELTERSNKHLKGSKGTLVFLRGQRHQKCVFFPAASDFWVAGAPSSCTILTDVYFQNIWSPHKVSEGLRTSFELHIRARPAGGHSMCRQSKAFQLWKTHPLVCIGVCVFLILRHDCNTEGFYKCQVSLCSMQKVLMSLDCLER